MKEGNELCDVATSIITNPRGNKRPFIQIVRHTQECSVCNPKLIAASIAKTVFSPRLLQKVQHML